MIIIRAELEQNVVMEMGQGRALHRSAGKLQFHVMITCNAYV